MNHWLVIVNDLLIDSLCALASSSVASVPWNEALEEANAVWLTDRCFPPPPNTPATTDRCFPPPPNTPATTTHRPTNFPHSLIVVVVVVVVVGVVVVVFVTLIFVLILLTYSSSFSS